MDQSSYSMLSQRTSAKFIVDNYSEYLSNPPTEDNLTTILNLYIRITEVLSRYPSGYAYINTIQKSSADVRFHMRQGHKNKLLELIQEYQ